MAKRYVEILVSGYLCDSDDELEPENYSMAYLSVIGPPAESFDHILRVIFKDTSVWSGDLKISEPLISLVDYEIFRSKNE